jgi:hypothetical protein
MLVQYYYKLVKYKLNKFEAFINTYIERTSLDLTEAGAGTHSRTLTSI